MLKKSLIGLVVIALAGGGCYGYSQYQAKVEADKRKVATDIKKVVIEQRKNQLVKLKEQRAEKEKEAEFAKVHYPSEDIFVDVDVIAKLSSENLKILGVCSDLLN